MYENPITAYIQIDDFPFPRRQTANALACHILIPVSFLASQPILPQLVT